jgi:hypothetical protein
MGLRIPGSLQSHMTTYALKSWVDRGGFPRKQYFELIDLYLQKLNALNTTGDALSGTQVATMLAATVDGEGQLLYYILNNGQSIDDEDRWFQVCLAAGWAIFQRYTREVENGKWST